MNKKDAIVNTLRLDSIFNLLKWDDRAILHAYKLQRNWVHLPTNINQLVEFVELHEIETPVLKVGQDRMSYIYYEGNLITTDDYRLENSELEKQLINSMQ